METPAALLRYEHDILMGAVEKTKAIQAISEQELYRNTLQDVILFFRNFTETYHHPKEEDFLYPVLRNRSENMSNAFLKEIYDNHEDFKSLMAEIENNFVTYNFVLLRNSFDNYLKLMKEHIMRENAIVLSVADSLLSKDEQAEISAQFRQLDEKNGEKNQLIIQIQQLTIPPI